MFKKRRRRADREDRALAAGDRGAADDHGDGGGDGDQGGDDAEDVLVPVAKAARRTAAAAGAVSARSEDRKQPAVHAGRKPEDAEKGAADEAGPEVAGSASDGKAKNKKPASRYGPRSATANIKTTVVMDYQPDVCKDFKETGYCGFGDNCKFIHDRGDYKSGWELEKEWQDKERKRKDDLRAGIVADDDEAGDTAGSGAKRRKPELPFACHLCRQPFTKPVVTLCGHYFCRKCAFAHNAQSGRCAVCNKPTKGIFNAADDLLPAATDSHAAS